MNHHDDINEMMAHIRIVEVNGQNACRLYQAGEVSLSKLVAIIAEDLYAEGYRKGIKEGEVAT